MLTNAEKEKVFTIGLMDYAPKKLERPTIATIPHTILFEREEKYIPYYNEYFFLEKGEISLVLLLTRVEHVDFMGKDDKGQPIAASVAIVEGREFYRTLIITKEVKGMHNHD